MFCRNCGSEISQNGRYCTKCGTPITAGQPEEEKIITTNRNKKTVIKIFGVLVLLIVLTISGIVGGKCFYDYQKMSHRDEYVAKLNSWIEQEETENINYVFSEEEKQRYEDDIEKLQRDMNDGEADTKTLDQEKVAIVEFLEDVKEENVDMVLELKKELESADISKGLEDDVKTIEKLRKSVEGSISEKNYAAAWEDLQEWQEVVNLITTPLDTYKVSVKQHDISEYPTLRIYVDVTDSEGNFIKGLNKSSFYLNEKRSIKGEMKRQTITNVTQLDENEGISIALVADISGSMEYVLPQTKSAMKNFLGTVQFDKGDEVELTQFSDNAYVCNSFTNNRNELNSAIDEMYADGGTRLYDTLISEIDRVYSRQNAKCVIGFTDGQDNQSYYKAQDVIDYARMYNIPIFLVGIGTGCDEATLKDIAKKTGGRYENIDDIASLEEIYNSIYKQEKEVYLLEYDISNPDDFDASCNLDIYVRTDDKNGGYAQNYEILPKDFFDVMYSRFLVAGIDCQTKGERNLLDSGIIVTTEEAFKDENCVAYQSQEAINTGGVGTRQSNVFEVLVSHDVLNVYKEGDGYVVYGVSNYDVSKVKKYSSVSSDKEKQKIYEYYGDNVNPESVFQIESNISNYEKLTMVKDSDGKWKFKTRVYEREDGEKAYFVNQVYRALLQ